MNCFRFIPALLLFILFCGCVREDNSDCLEVDNTNVFLYFNNTGQKGDDEFLSRVKRVDLMIFSEEGYFLQRHVIEEELTEMAGAKLHLQPGNYQLIQWGNIDTGSRFTTLDSTTTIHQAKLYLNSGTTADSLYYGPRKTSTAATEYSLYELIVPEEGTVEKNIEFMSAYYTVNVHVKGFEDPVKGVTQAPTISMTSVPEGYDFHLEPGLYRSTLRQTATLNNSGEFELAEASFHTTHFDVENPIEIDIIKRTTGLSQYTVNLQEILVANSYILRMGVHVNIDVYVEFQEDGDVEVTLTFPGWETNDIEPD